MIRMIVLTLLGCTGLVIGADQISPAAGQDIVGALQWDKLVGTGGSFCLLFMALRFLLNKTEAQAAKIDRLHQEKEDIYKVIINRSNEVMAEVRDAIRNMSTKTH